MALRGCDLSEGIGLDHQPMYWTNFKIGSGAWPRWLVGSEMGQC